MTTPESFVFEAVDTTDHAALSLAVVELFLDWELPPDRIVVEPLADGRVVLHAHGGRRVKRGPIGRRNG